jgi:thiamine pyrophosphokinase
MSSHHIIREKQEPALLILGLNNFTDELLGQLLEWSPTIMVTSDTAEQLNSMGIKYDVLVGDIETRDNYQADIKYIPQGNNDAELAALKYLLANGYPAVNVVTDNLNLEHYKAYAERINIVIFHNYQKIYPVKSGFTKWKPEGELISLPVNASGLHFTGLQNLGESIYQTVADGFFTISFNDPLLFIAETIA